jgi:hypothetical protein
MGLLGVMTGLFRGLICGLNFNAFPFVDSTGRNVFSNLGVTQVSNKAFFNNPANSSSVRLTTPAKKDFLFSLDFDIAFTVNVQSYAGKSDQLLVYCADAGSTSTLEFFLNSDGNVRLGFIQGGSIQTNSLASSGYLLPVGVDVVLKVERRGATARVYADNVQIAIINGTLTARTKVLRGLTLGAEASIGGYGLYGTIDDFSWTNI